MSLRLTIEGVPSAERPQIENVNTFWFDDCSAKQRFQKNEEFDALILSRFGAQVERGLQDKLSNWELSPAGLLALIILVDQFTRNIYRSTPKMVSGDLQALRYSRILVKQGALARATEGEAQFALMPFMHSEELSVQREGIPLFEKHTSPQVVNFAIRHLKIIEKFGRFPHRNAWLGRTSREPELAFLRTKGSSF